MKTKRKTPDIRFRGFSDDWEQRKLGSITDSFSGGTPSAGNSEYYGGTIPFIRSGEISSDKTELFVTEVGLNNSSAKMVKKGDILYALYGATSGEVSISKINGAINQAILAIRSIENDDHYLIAQWLRTQKERIISTYLQGGQGNLSGSIVKGLMITLPENKDEQKMISLFFSNLDNLITLHQRKLQQLKEVKRGMLQKMYCKRKSKLPELRFSDFKEQWLSTDLENLTTITTGKLDANAMCENGKYDFYTSGIKKYKIDTPAFKGPAITIAGNGATVGYMHLANGEFNAYQRTYVLREFSANREFLFYELNNILPRKIQEESRTGNIPYIVMDMLTKLSITIPIDIQEQLRIGSLFAKLDRMIELQEREIELLEETKKGFLQKMFV